MTTDEERTPGWVLAFRYLTGTILIGSGLYITKGLGVALTIVGALILIMSLIGTVIQHAK